MSVVVASTEGAVGFVRLNRPEARNAFSEEMRLALPDALERMDRDRSIRCIVISGGERAFSAGGDLAVMRELSPAQSWRRPQAECFIRMSAIGTPMIAAVCGWALGGGCELALLCDMIVAGENARFGLPEIGVGVIPGGGGTQRLTRIVGKQRAMEIVLTGRALDAHEAAAMGFVNRVVSPERCLPEAAELARAVAARAPLAIELGRAAVLAADEMALSAGLDHERRLYSLAMASEDRVEGMSAFLEKRDPEFSGR